MKTAIVHGILLVAMLLFAYQTWTRDTSIKVNAGDVEVWTEDPGDLKAIFFQTKDRTVKVERRGDGAEGYFWGTDNKITKRPKKKNPTAPPTTPDPTAPPDGDPAKKGAAPAKGEPAPAKQAPAPTRKEPAPAKTEPAPAPAGTPGPAGTIHKRFIQGPLPEEAKKRKPKPADPEPDTLKPTPPPEEKKADKKPAPKPDTTKPDTKPDTAAKPDTTGKASPDPAGKESPDTAKPDQPGPPPDDGHGHGAAHGDPHGAPAEPPPAVEMEEQTTVREFPVSGEKFDKALAGLVKMRASHKLGELTEEQKLEYELVEIDKPLPTIELSFASSIRTLVLGPKVMGGKWRYALELETGIGYVILNDLIAPFEEGERGLAPDALVPTGDKVAAAEITGAGKSRSVKRITLEGADDEKSKKTWADASGEPDETAAMFLNLLESSVKRPKSYAPDLDVATLTELVAVTYKDTAGKVLTTLTLYKRAAPPKDDGTPSEPATEYYVTTEKTRVPGLIDVGAGEEIEAAVTSAL